MRTECGANLKSGLHSYPRCVTPNLFNRELYKAKHMFGHLFVIIYGIHVHLSCYLPRISKSIHLCFITRPSKIEPPYTYQQFYSWKEEVHVPYL